MRRIGQAWEQEGRNQCVPQGASRSTNQAAERAYYAGAREVHDVLFAASESRTGDFVATAQLLDYLDNLGVDIAAFEQKDRGHV